MFWVGSGLIQVTGGKGLLYIPIVWNWMDWAIRQAGRITSGIICGGSMRVGMLRSLSCMVIICRLVACSN